MMRFVLYLILAYILYQFIFKLVIPVYMTTRKIKKGFRDMQDRMQQQSAGEQKGPGFNGQSKSSATAPKPKAGDYIDFEEVK